MYYYHRGLCFADSEGKLDAHISNKDSSAEVNVSDIYNLPAEEHEERSISQNPSRGTSFSLPNGALPLLCTIISFHIIVVAKSRAFYNFI